MKKKNQRKEICENEHEEDDLDQMIEATSEINSTIIEESFEIPSFTDLRNTQENVFGDYSLPDKTPPNSISETKINDEKTNDNNLSLELDLAQATEISE